VVDCRLAASVQHIAVEPRAPRRTEVARRAAAPRPSRCAERVGSKREFRRPRLRKNGIRDPRLLMESNEQLAIARRCDPGDAGTENSERRAMAARRNRAQTGIQKK